MSTEAKVRLCSACGEDCSGQPRIKDKKGRYLHKTCADRVRAKQKAAKKPMDDINTPIHPASAVASSASMADFYGDALKEVAQTCPSCNNSMKEGTSLCVQCGYNFESGKSLKTTALVEKAPKDKSGAPSDNSVYIGFGVFAVLMGLGAGGSFKPELYIPLLLTSVLISLPLWLWITVEAFKQTVGRGLLTLFLPFYVLYWLNTHCDKPTVKAVGVALYGSQVLLRVLAVTGVLPAPDFTEIT